MPNKTARQAAIANAAAQTGTTGWVTRKDNVIEGPHGHWYAIYKDELVAAPMSRFSGPPTHPSTQDDWMDGGWYDPHELTDTEHSALCLRLGRRSAHA